MRAAAEGSARRSIRRRTSTPRPSTAATSPRCSRSARSSRRGSGADGTGHQQTITVDVNGEPYEREVEARRLLVHFIRDDLDLTGTHVGCDTGNCGACTVLFNGDARKSCMMLAVQADGASIETVEGLARDGELHALQQAFCDHHALQCGYCTPGMLMSAKALLDTNPSPTEDEIRKAIQGNICRCTGYVNIVEAIEGGREMTDTTVERAARRRAERDEARLRAARASRARRTSGSSRARASSSTT